MQIPILLGRSFDDRDRPGAPGGVVWMVLREVLVLAAIGLAIGAPTSARRLKTCRSFPFRSETE